MTPISLHVGQLRYVVIQTSRSRSYNTQPLPCHLVQFTTGLYPVSLCNIDAYVELALATIKENEPSGVCMAGPSEQDILLAGCRTFDTCDPLV